VVSLPKFAAPVCSNTHRAQRTQRKLAAAEACQLTVELRFHVGAILKLKRAHSRSSQEPVLEIMRQRD
jgi:hypothetical protein